MSTCHSVFLGIIQGITEFLPVSSTAHAMWYRKVLDLQQDRAFDIFLNVGTILAIIVYYNRDIFKLVLGFWDFIFRNNTKNKYNFLTYIFASIPVIVCGVLFELYFNLSNLPKYLSAALLFIFAIILYICDKNKEENNIKPSRYDAFLIGLSQVLALFPGVSRLGICFSMMRNLGYARTESFKFSMILSMFPVAGICVVNFAKVLSGKIIVNSHTDVAIGCFVSFIFGLISLKCVTSFLQRHTMRIIVVYRIIFAIGLFLILNK